MPAPPAINRAMTPFEWAQLVALSVLWGGSFFFVGVAIKELPPLTIVVLRVALAAIALHLVIRLIGVRLPGSPKIWAAFVVMGLLNNVIPFTLIVWGQTQVASGVASILNATSPLFTALVAHAATPDEKLTAGRLVGVIVGFAGVAVMIGGSASTCSTAACSPSSRSSAPPSPMRSPACSAGASAPSASRRSRPRPAR